MRREEERVELRGGEKRREEERGGETRREEERGREEKTRSTTWPDVIKDERAFVEKCCEMELRDRKKRGAIF